MTPEEIKQKMSEAADAVQHVQEKVVQLEKAYDGVDFASMKDAADKGAKALEEVQDLKQKFNAEEQVERLKAIEKAVALFKQNPNAEGTDPKHKQDFYSYLRKGTPIPAETIEAYCEDVARKSIIHSDKTKEAAYQKALVEGSNADGGFFITPERSTQIIKRNFETSPMRLVASVVTTTTNEIEFVLDDDEASCGWVGEVATRSETDTPQVGLVKIPVHELYAKPKATQRMLDDAGFDVEGWLQGKVTDIFGRTENTAFVSGTGAASPKGFLDYAAWAAAGTYERDALERYTSTGTSALLDEPLDFIELQGLLHEPYQMGASWMMQRGTFTSLIGLQDGNGNFLINFAMMKEGTDKILLGKPVIFASDMPTVAANSLSVAYGDFSSYVIVDRFGIRVLRDPYSAKPYVEFYSTKRVGGGLIGYDKIKIMATKA